MTEVKIIRTINLTKLAKEYSQGGFKSKAWREYGIGGDGFIYFRGPTSGYSFSNWTQVEIAGIPLDSETLKDMAISFLGENKNIIIGD